MEEEMNDRGLITGIRSATYGMAGVEIVKLMRISMLGTARGVMETLNQKQRRRARCGGQSRGKKNNFCTVALLFKAAAIPVLVARPPPLIRSTSSVAVNCVSFLQINLTERYI
jgi:hypothetical protein